MITLHQQRDTEAAYTPKRGAMWIAETVIDGIPYTARSQNGAPNELARVLVDAGVGDDAMRVYHEGVCGYLEWPSMHQAATRTFSEGSLTPLRCVKYAVPVK